MKVLIYGASGFLGSHLARHMKAAGHHVNGFVRRESAAQELKQQGIHPIIGDLENLDDAIAHMANADAIIYASQLMMEEEFNTVSAMLDSIANTNKTFIFTSGTGVLSERTDGEWSDRTFTDYEEIIPSKYIGDRQKVENLVRESSSRGIRGVVFRPPLIWGNGQTILLNLLYESAAKTGSVCYIGRGLNLYTSVHIEDLAEAYKLAIDKGVAGALYHAVSGETNYRSLAQAVAKDLNLPTRSIDLSEGAEIWGKFPALIVMSTCSRSRSPRAREELGWAPSKERLDIMDDVGHTNYQKLMHSN